MELSPIATSPILIQSQEHGASKRWGNGWIGTILKGRICANWKANTLMAFTVFHVVVAAISFFSGEWLLASLFLMNAGVDAVLHREFRDLASLQKQTIRHGKNNNSQMVQNYLLKENVDELQSINTSFNGKVNHLEGQIGRLEKNVLKQEEQIARNDEIQKALEENLQSMKATLQGHKDLTAAQKLELVKTITHLEGQRATLKDFNQEMSQGLKARIQDFTTIAGQVKTMNADGVQLLRDAQVKLAVTQAKQRTLDDSLAQRQEELQTTTKKLALVTALLQKAALGNVRSQEELQQKASKLAAQLVRLTAPSSSPRLLQPFGAPPVLSY